CSPDIAERRSRRSQSGGLIDLGEDIVERLGDIPSGIMAPHLGEVADVADVVADAIFIDVNVVHFPSAQRRAALEGLENGDAVRAATADVVDLAATWIFEKGMNEAGHVEGVNIVSHLFALVTKDLVGAPFDIAFDEVAEKPVQLDAAVVRA